MNRIPGIALCVAIAGISVLLQMVEVRLFGHPWIESLVLAIVIGAIVRSVIDLPAAIEPGVSLAAKELLEIAVFLLGATVDLRVVASAGPLLLVGTLTIVAASLVLSYVVGRAFQLNHRLALLVSCGNSICGNSAIIAVAPVIDAEPDDVAAAISFTAAMGVVVVMLLPLLMRLTMISPMQYGVVAGLTVYAVPQVLAATIPAGAVAGSTGTIVKLVRVLLLAPTIFVLALLHHERTPERWMSLTRAMPWFIVGFIGLAIVRSLGWLPESVIQAARGAVIVLTVLAMSALGLGVNVRALRRVGARLAGAVTVSLLVLFFLSVGLAALVGRSTS